jgi:hypothetical protein
VLSIVCIDLPQEVEEGRLDEGLPRLQGALVDGLLGGKLDEGLGDVGVLGLGQEAERGLLSWASRSDADSAWFSAPMTPRAA